MKICRSCLCLAILLVASVQAEEKPRRRRRFVTYDGPETVVRTAVPEGRSEQVNPTEGQRALERETNRPGYSSRSEPAGTTMPGMTSLRPIQIADEEEEQEDEDWITAQDLMTTEDQVEMELEQQPEETVEEMELVEWENLQEAMIEEEMDDTTEEDPTIEETVEQRQEEAERALREENRGRAGQEAGGLQMDAVLEAQTEGNSQGQMERMEEPADVALEPVLQPILLSGDGGTAVIGSPTGGTNDFAGSRQMLTDLQSRWDPRERSGRASSGSGPSAVPMDSLRNPFANRPPVSAAPAFGSVGSEVQVQPEGPSRSSSGVEPASLPLQQPIRREPTDRIQSQLGAGAF